MVDNYRNNVRLLRLALAILVMLSHGNYLFGLDYSLVIFHAAEWAVNGFFIISGLLISWSIDRRFEWRAYAIKRFARIYPLYAVVIFAQLATLLYFSSEAVSLRDVGVYLAANLATLNFIKPTLGDMVDFPFNGSLWTIKIEIMFYMAMPIYLWFVRRLGLWFVILSWLLAFLYRYTLDDYSIRLARQLPGAMTFFIAGFVLHRHGRALVAWLKARWWHGAGLCLALALAWAALPPGYGVPMIKLAVLMAVLYMAAFYLPPLVPRYDLSYGIYLIHFPLFATMVHVGVLADIPRLAFAAGCIMVIMLSFAATNLVEEPMIRWGKRQAKRIDN